MLRAQAKSWGKAVYNVWCGVGLNQCLCTGTGQRGLVPVGINGALHTFFTRLSTAVSHSYFGQFTSVNRTLSPSFHRTYKDNYKVYISY